MSLTMDDLYRGDLDELLIESAALRRECDGLDWLMAALPDEQSDIVIALVRIARRLEGRAGIVERQIDHLQHPIRD
jgi:hypothetical protein